MLCGERGIVGEKGSGRRRKSEKAVNGERELLRRRRKSGKGVKWERELLGRGRRELGVLYGKKETIGEKGKGGGEKEKWERVLNGRESMGMKRLGCRVGQERIRVRVFLRDRMLRRGMGRGIGIEVRAGLGRCVRAVLLRWCVVRDWL